MRIKAAAQPGIAADRFARDRRHFERWYHALAAAECQTVGPLLPSCDHLLAPPLRDEIAPKRGQIFSHRSMALLYTQP
jgi:hypothetical protein